MSRENNAGWTGPFSPVWFGLACMALAWPVTWIGGHRWGACLLIPGAGALILWWDLRFRNGGVFLRRAYRLFALVTAVGLVTACLPGPVANRLYDRAWGCALIATALAFTIALDQEFRAWRRSESASAASSTGVAALEPSRDEADHER